MFLAKGKILWSFWKGSLSCLWHCLGWPLTAGEKRWVQCLEWKEQVFKVGC